MTSRNSGGTLSSNGICAPPPREPLHKVLADYQRNEWTEYWERCSLKLLAFRFGFAV